MAKVKKTTVKRKETKKGAPPVKKTSDREEQGPAALEEVRKRIRAQVSQTKATAETAASKAKRAKKEMPPKTEPGSMQVRKKGKSSKTREAGIAREQPRAKPQPDVNLAQKAVEGKPLPAAAPKARTGEAAEAISRVPVRGEKSTPILEGEKPQPRKVVVRAPITVKDLSAKYSVSPAELIGRLIKIGVFANINQFVNFETAAKLAAALGVSITQPEEAAEGKDKEETPSVRRDVQGLVPRPPIVTFLGHVDHGKTSLLDSIRKTRVAQDETGGITQHIGAYEVFTAKGAVTFLDTPGHQAFTEMRARGAKVTDVVVLVVAADDGIMPQTKEAIDHAMDAEATIVVAINKIDLPSADVDRVKRGLAEHGLTPEDWGGKTITVNVSAKTGQGIDDLLEMLLLEAELLELKANPSVPAQGTVIEAKLSKGSGPVATVLVHEGTLRVGDVVVCGDTIGRVRAMITDRGGRVREALPAMPVEISGLSGVPRAGDSLYVVKSEVRARQIIEERKREREEKGAGHAHITLEDLYEEIQAGKIRALKLIIKSDVQGSVEALRSTLVQLPTREVQLNIIHTGIGNVTKSDVMLAAASNAIVIGFHVDIEPDGREIMKLEQVDVRLYEIIYEVKSAIEKAMSGLLAPETKEVFLGSAEVRQVFKVSKIGVVAGSRVMKGKIVRNASCRLMRAGKKIHEGKITGLKRFKDDAREVNEGFECGISVSNFKDFVEGDSIEAFEIQTGGPRSL